MAVPGRVVLITGPAGSGKTTLGERLARRLGWRAVSEDEFWGANSVRHGWSGARTPEQEAMVQREVLESLLPTLETGTGATLEFVLYKEPPNPLTAYQQQFGSHGIRVDTVCLKPSADEALRRIRGRGRPDDLANPLIRDWVESQLACLEADSIDPDWLIDPTGFTSDELVDQMIDRLGLTR